MSQLIWAKPQTYHVHRFICHTAYCVMSLVKSFGKLDWTCQPILLPYFSTTDFWKFGICVDSGICPPQTLRMSTGTALWLYSDYQVGPYSKLIKTVSVYKQYSYHCTTGMHVWSSHRYSNTYSQKCGHCRGEILSAPVCGDWMMI